MGQQVARFRMGLLLWALLPMGVFGFVISSPRFDPLLEAPAWHFQIVTIASILAAAIGTAVGWAGHRLRNVQVSLLAMAFSSLATIFAIHGLASPGFLLGLTPVPGVAAQLSVLVAAFWLWLSSRPGDHPVVARLGKIRPWMMPAWTVLLGGLMILIMSAPQVRAFFPIHLSPFKWIAAAVTLWLDLLVMHHYWISYRYARLPLQAAILHSTVWLTGAQVSIAAGRLLHLSWWLYHALLLGAMAVMAAGLLRQYTIDAFATISAAVRGLLNADPAERIEAGIPPAIRELVVKTERHDPYTAGHSYRVALYALHLGQGLGLPPEQLRALAQGAIVHDIGKTEVPAAILNKPGRLTPEEWTIIQSHPVVGHRMGKLLGFMQDELDIIRHHHERYDGTGYPDRLAGEQIPLLARVLAVADVYDALTSHRAYRAAWSHAQAMEWIAAGAGTQFDPECVAVWRRITAEPPRVERYPSWLSQVAESAGRVESTGQLV